MGGRFFWKSSLKFASICCLLLFASFRIPDLIPPPTPRPFVQQPPVSVETEKIEQLEKIDPRNAAEEYELALYYILADKRDQAKIHLAIALELEPEFLEAEIQMGFLLLWENQTDEAYEYFSAVLARKPCEKRALSGLEQIAKKRSDSGTFELYRKILLCEPQNSDTLFFLGLLYRRNNQLEEAEKTFLEVLRLSPEYTDAAVELARIYERGENWGALSELYEKYPSNPEIQHIYARALAGRQKYKQAKKIYAQIPPDEQIWKESWEVKSHTDIATLLEGAHTAAKENDPTLGVPVVKDYYSLAALSLLFPISNQWRLDAKGFLYHQRENDIFPPVGVNYNVYSGGGTLTSHYFFAPNWKWDVVARSFEAWGAGQMTYPFHKTTRVEPGTLLILNSEQLFVLDAHVESFIIKNFAEGISELLRTDYYQGAYGYRPDVKIHPQVEVWAGWVYYHDSLHNWENKQSGRAQIDLYFPSLTTSYLFEHSGFKHLNVNYYSYKHQLRNTIEVKYRQEVRSQLYFEMFWDHTWEVTYDFFMPIDRFLFASTRLYLIWNTYTAQMSWRYKDSLKIEMGGHYLYNTLPYRDWNLHGSLLWQF